MLVALFALLIATLTTNVAANVVAPANGFANLWPARINFARGGILTGIVGIAIMPWRLLENADRYMGGCRVLRLPRPIAGIFIADYWVVRRGTACRCRISTTAAASTAAGTRARLALAAGMRRRAGRPRDSARSGRSTITRGSSGFAVAFVVYCDLLMQDRLRAGERTDAAASRSPDRFTI